MNNDLSEYSAELFGIGGKPTKKEKKTILKKLKEAKKNVWLDEENK